MAVSKIAVMALVGILAVPILLGYAFNLSEVAVTDYKPNGESVNVTELLQTGTAYTSANANEHKLNTDFEYNGIKYIPNYKTISQTKTTYQLYQTTVTINAGQSILWTLEWLADIELYLFIGRGSDITLQIYDSSNVLLSTTDHLVSMDYVADDNVIYKSWDGGSNYISGITQNHQIKLTNNSASAVTIEYKTSASVGTNYVNLANGFYLTRINHYASAKLNLPSLTKSILLTLELNSIVDSSYEFRIQAGDARLLFTKTTTGGIPSWSVTDLIHNTVFVDNLYFDSSRAANTYQLYINSENISIDSSSTPTYYTNRTNIELRYVGNWPVIFGNANYYQKYDLTYDRSTTGSNTFDRVLFSTPSTTTYSNSPLMRIDSALYSAIAYQIISDTTYNPADFKTNPTTTLSVQNPGLSLSFAGNTYTVDSTGNITLGTHKVSVNGLKLESIPVPVGYENRINGNVISVTAEPSTISFNGNWGASVSTIGNTATTYTKTEWNAGSFAWDGIDQNFLMVGLITCLGAFIALGIYLRKTGKGLMPLLIVCGCAAGLFFCMI